MPDISQRLEAPENIPGKLAFIGRRQFTALRVPITVPVLICPPVVVDVDLGVIGILATYTNPAVQTTDNDKTPEDGTFDTPTVATSVA